MWRTKEDKQTNLNFPAWANRWRVILVSEIGCTGREAGLGREKRRDHNKLGFGYITLEFLWILKWKKTVVIWEHKSGPRGEHSYSETDLRAHVDNVDK